MVYMDGKGVPEIVESSITSDIYKYFVRFAFWDSLCLSVKIKSLDSKGLDSSLILPSLVQINVLNPLRSTSLTKT